MTYWFKPNSHWNVVSEEIYMFLQGVGYQVGGNGRLKITEEEKK